MTALFDEPSRTDLPAQPGLEDVRVSVIKAGLGAIPVLGGALVEGLGLVLTPPLNRRRDEWLQDLARRLLDLEARVEGFRFEDLGKNEQFVSATLQATQVALRTHDQEKLQALRNAVLNVALNKGSEDDRQGIFLSLVDRLTPSHLRMLKMLDRPNQLSDMNVVTAFSGNPQFQNIGWDGVRLLFEELKQTALIRLSDEVPRTFRTSTWGHDFLTFVSAPKELEFEHE